MKDLKVVAVLVVFVAAFMFDGKGAITTYLHNAEVAYVMEQVTKLENVGANDKGSLYYGMYKEFKKDLARLQK